MKILAIGDMHVKKDNIEESQRLIHWIFETAYASQPDAILFMGDQYDTMGIVRVEVIRFWTEAYSRLAQLGIPTLSLIGNHDLNSEATASSMVAHRELTRVIGNPWLYPIDKVGFVGFIRDNSEFEKAVIDLKSRGASVIFCHAEFNGAQFESGAYAPHGIDSSKFSDVKFISGHFHKAQKFANVWYTGTPRHLTRSDIGEVKGINLIDTDDLSKTVFIPTPEDVCQPFRFFEITNEDQIPNIPETLDFGRVYVDVKGSEDLIKKVKKKLPVGARLRTFEESDSVRQLEIRESEGIPTAFLKYSSKFFESNAIDDSDQKEIMKVVYSMCPSLRNGETA